jgi:hypothetical protein
MEGSDRPETESARGPYVATIAVGVVFGLVAGSIVWLAYFGRRINFLLLPPITVLVSWGVGAGSVGALVAAGYYTGTRRAPATRTFLWRLAGMAVGGIGGMAYGIGKFQEIDEAVGRRDLASITALEPYFFWAPLVGSAVGLLLAILLTVWPSE